MTFQALYIGILVGAIIGLYQLASHYAIIGSDFFFTTSNPYLIGFFVFLIFGLAVLSNFAVDHFKDLAGSGVPNYECMIHQNREIVWYKALPLMFINSIYAFFTGAGLGSEGPSVFLGGMVGSSASKLFNDNDKTATAIGGGVGFGCAFFCPLAGVIYIFEESLNHHFSWRLVYRGVVAAIVAYFIRGLIFDHKLISLGDVTMLSINKYWVILLIAISSFVAGALFKVGIIRFKDLLKKYEKNFLVKNRIFILLIIVLIVGRYFNSYNGGGGKIISMLLSLESLSLITGLIVFRLIFTMFSANGKLSGGLLVPMFAVGGLASILVIKLIERTGIQMSDDIAIYAICGMLATFAIVTKSPLTAIAIAFSVCDYRLTFIPALVCIALTHLLGMLFNTSDIYEDLVLRL